MNTTENKLQELKEREEKELAMGGAKGVEKQHDKGKLTARERLEALFDPHSFRELDMFVRHRCTHFDMSKTFIPGEGVVTGHGTVNNRLVYAYSQDSGERGFRKVSILSLDTATYFTATHVHLE